MHKTLIAGVVLALFATAAIAAGGTGTGKGNPPQPAKAAAAATAPAPVISGVMMIHHRVADYAKWRPAFDGHKSMQEANGLTNPRVYAGKDANDVWITFDMADEAKAKAFAKSKELRETMKNAGVEGHPTITYLTPAK